MIQTHLSICTKCQKAVEHFKQDLSDFGKLAQHFSPKPKRQISLPPKKDTVLFLGSWKWRLSFGAVFSVCFAFIIIWWSGLINTVYHIKPSQELWEDEKLMTEISSLSENALPQLYMDISGEPDPETEIDFMEFVVPSNENTILS